MNKIDISTEKKKKEIYEIFDSCSTKTEVYQRFGISDNTLGKGYVEKIAAEIGFDFSIYKERKKRYCLFCGKELKKGQKKFCSSSCSAKYFNGGKHLKEETKKKISESLKKRNAEKTETREPKLCVVCGKELSGTNKKHCSSECRKSVYQGNRKSVTIVCKYCGREFTGLYGRKFCCNECSAAYNADKTIYAWKNGEYKIGESCELPQSIRTYLFNKANYQCEICGFEGYNKKTGKTILQIHHIDGDSKNSQEENLQVICPNCHAMTENYMGLNKGKSGRKTRYKKESNAKR